MKRLLLFKVLIIFFSFCWNPSYGQDWFAVGTGTNDHVAAMVEYNGELYVGGDFTTAGGLTVNYIARWNGTRWDSVGHGLDGHVRCLAIYNGELFAGGSFTHAGGQYTPFVARWNGSSWGPADLGMSSYVNSMTTYHGKLYAGGIFSYASGIATAGIARWDGVSWDSVGSGIGGPEPYLECLKVYNDVLYAGGEFTTAGNIPVGLIAQWNDTTWSAVGGAAVSGSTFQVVYVLEVFQSQLYAGGSFDTIGNAPVKYLAKLSSGNWIPLNTGTTNGELGALLSDSTHLYIGGTFTTLGGVSADQVGAWNGTAFSRMGNGTNGFTFALGFYNGDLYAGGWFTTAGTHPTAHIAKWSAVAGIEESIKNEFVRIWPTPSDGTLFISKERPFESSRLQLYNVLGEQVKEVLLSSDLTQLDLSKEPKGVYLYRIIAENKLVSTGKIILN